MGDSASAALVQQKSELYDRRRQFGDLVATGLEELVEHRNRDLLSIIQNKKDQSSGKYLDAIHGKRDNEFPRSSSCLRCP